MFSKQPEPEKQKLEGIIIRTQPGGDYHDMMALVLVQNGDIYNVRSKFLCENDRVVIEPDGHNPDNNARIVKNYTLAQQIADKKQLLEADLANTMANETTTSTSNKKPKM